jgi:hypothetical protein
MITLKLLFSLTWGDGLGIDLVIQSLLIQLIFPFFCNYCSHSVALNPLSGNL